MTDSVPQEQPQPTLNARWFYLRQNQTLFVSIDDLVNELKSWPVEYVQQQPSVDLLMSLIVGLEASADIALRQLHQIDEVGKEKKNATS